MHGYLAYGLVGLVVGSFLNVVIDRLPAGRSLLHPPSHCSSCGRELSPLELIPVLSYLVLGGRCRTCGAPIPPRVLVVEILTGLVFALLYGVYGATLQLLIATVYACVLFAVMFIDLEHMLIPNTLVLPATGFALLMTPFWRLPFHPRFRGAVLRFLQNIGAHTGFSLFVLNVSSQIAGGLLGFLIFLLIWFVTLKVMGVDAMGFGDVKLAAFCGLVVAFPGILIAVFGSFILGGLVGGILLASGMADRKTPVPFAPFLVTTTFFLMVSGEALLFFI
ncbi:MAG: prepilin peptidase [Anaerolineales bacterium]